MDHGKTTLIQALTGIDADRLPEEKARGMTIDIGFAYYDSAMHGRVSIVDVPGHERFIANMLVGALGVDAALLCVAADAGVMPQTREHFHILSLLPVEKMVVALTRSDLVDSEMIALVSDEVKELLADTRFEGNPIVPVSALSGIGLEELKTELDRALEGPSGELGKTWYLPIDRVFSVKGHGCVVTGTLAEGAVSVGDTAVIEPGSLEVRIRAIHVHDEPQTRSEKGQRTALNLGGVKIEDVERGKALGPRGSLFATENLDAKMKWLVPPKHGLRIRLSVGASEVMGKVFLNDSDPEIAQFRLEEPVAVALNQPLIVRRYSPPDLLGGGKVVVPRAIVRRKSEEVRLVKEGESEASRILSAIGDSEAGVSTEEICRLLGRSAQALGGEFERLLEGEKVLGFAGLWFQPGPFERATDKLLTALLELHAESPTLNLVPREKAVSRARLKWTGKPLDRIVAELARQGKIGVNGTSIRHAEFKLEISPKQRLFLDRVSDALMVSGLNVPSERELAQSLNVPIQAVEEILRIGVEAGDLVRVFEGIYYCRVQITQLAEALRARYGTRSFTAAEFRDAMGTTRKYAIPLLEYLDLTRITLRTGDSRSLR